MLFVSNDKESKMNKVKFIRDKNGNDLEIGDSVKFTPFISPFFKMTDQFGEVKNIDLSPEGLAIITIHRFGDKEDEFWYRHSDMVIKSV